MSAKILDLDIETSPITVHAWSLRDLNVGLNQIRQDPRVIGVGAKWRGKKKVQFLSEYHHDRWSMLEGARDLLDEADIVVHYNGNGFDIPWLNGEFLREGIDPPSPFRNIDLYRVVRRAIRLPSYKLAYVSRVLGLEGKVSHYGHGLWVDCLEGDEETKRRAWALMARYCKQDVALLEKVHDRLLPYVTSVNMGLYADTDERACQKCGSTDLESRGTAHTAMRSYRQFRCRTCGGWTRDSRSSGSVSVTAVTS